MAAPDHFIFSDREKARKIILKDFFRDSQFFRRLIRIHLIRAEHLFGIGIDSKGHILLFRFKRGQYRIHGNRRLHFLKHRRVHRNLYHAGEIALRIRHRSTAEAIRIFQIIRIRFVLNQQRFSLKHPAEFIGHASGIR